MNDYCELDEQVKKHACDFYKIISNIKGDIQFKEIFLFDYIAHILSSFLSIKVNKFNITHNEIEKYIDQRLDGLFQHVMSRIKIIESSNILTNDKKTIH